VLLSLSLSSLPASRRAPGEQAPALGPRAAVALGDVLQLSSIAVVYCSRLLQSSIAVVYCSRLLQSSIAVVYCSRLLQSSIAVVAVVQ
jgi:hypothetical protein